MISAIMRLFIKIHSNMCEQGKNNNKEFIICLTAKPNKKDFLNDWSFLWTPLSPDLNSLDYAIWDVLEKKNKCNFPSNINSLKTAIEE